MFSLLRIGKYYNFAKYIVNKQKSNMDHPQPTTPGEMPWYAIRTFNCQEQKVSRYLKERGIVHFIPMTYSVAQSKDGKPKPILKPAIHNLLFVQKSGTQKDTVQALQECSTPVSIFRQPGSKKLCEITDREMVELRLLCDPEYQTSLYMTQSEAEVMVGKEVRVVKGPFKGSVGKLVRKDKQYYFLKAIIGMGVMVRISRWYCEPL